MSAAEPFKQCTLCGTSWVDYREFVTDRSLRVEGYQASVLAPEYCFVLVTHRVKGCGTTLAVPAEALRMLYEECHGTAAPAAAESGWNLGPTTLAEAEEAWVRQVVAWLRSHELPTPDAEPVLATAAAG